MTTKPEELKEEFWNNESPLTVARTPILFWVIMVTMAAIAMQIAVKPHLELTLVFVLVIAMHLAMHWYSPVLADRRPWLYFTVQALLIYSSAYFLTIGFMVVLIGLYPILISQSLGVYAEKRKILFVALLSYGLFCLAIGIIGSWDDLKMYIPLLILMMVIVIAYSMLFFNQVRARIRTQSFLQELSDAHKKVEELTLINERQRMARDLHDTLAQGLAGIIMKLEAVDAHLSKGNGDRARQIIHLSMSQARKTLSDARSAIDDLRKTSLSDINFEAAVQEEVLRFSQATGIATKVHIELSRSLPVLWMEHGLFILSECLTNIARHAQATQVRVVLANQLGSLQLEVRDNGIGFDMDAIGKQPGHYGLLGISERVRILGGKLQLQSKAGEGTRITIHADLYKGEHQDV